MAEQKTEIQVAEEWLEIAIQNWQEEIKLLNIGNTNDLFNSFVGRVIGSAGSVTAINLAYKYYGKYVDMGVGRGMPVGSARMLGSSFSKKRNAKGQLHKYNRSKKPWYTGGKSGINYQVFRLAQILGGMSADKASKNVTAGFKNFKIDFN